MSGRFAEPPKPPWEQRRWVPPACYYDKPEPMSGEERLLAMIGLAEDAIGKMASCIRYYGFVNSGETGHDYEQAIANLGRMTVLDIISRAGCGYKAFTIPYKGKVHQ